MRTTCSATTGLFSRSKYDRPWLLWLKIQLNIFFGSWRWPWAEAFLTFRKPNYPPKSWKIVPRCLKLMRSDSSELSSKWDRARRESFNIRPKNLRKYSCDSSRMASITQSRPEFWYGTFRRHLTKYLDTTTFFARASEPPMSFQKLGLDNNQDFISFSINLSAMLRRIHW